jgi:hypothetical protein
MRKRHGVFFGFAVLLITAIFTLAGCDTNGGDDGGGGDSSSTGQSFKSRYDEAISAGRYYDFALEYASSTHSLQTFTDRRFETYAYVETYMLPYASSTHSLQTFRERFEQARNVFNRNYEYNLAYASSTHSFQTFNNRYDEAIGAGNGNAYSLAYAKSRHSP